MLRANAKLLLVFVLLLVAAPAFAGEFECGQGVVSEKDLMGKIEGRYAAIQDLRGRFSQRSYFIGLDEERFSAGKVFFKKGGKMNWEYETPETQRFVSDGNALWFYQPELQQATVSDFSSAFTSDLPVSFLLGIGKLSESFELKEACKNSRGLVLSLQPTKPDAAIDSFRLLVRSDYTPLGAQIRDLGGNETEIVFSDVVVNTQLADAEFQFKAPLGVDIIDERGKKPSAQEAP